MSFIGALCFLIVTAVLWGCIASIVSSSFISSGLRERGSATVVVILLFSVLLSSVLLLRPHEDTFVGLDNSGYRLMARAFQADRPLHGVDSLLASVPRKIRNDFMLLPTMDERNTRDRSFLVESLDTCETEPFFYPLLPLCATGFDLFVPGDALDYFVPMVGFLFVVACLLTGAAAGGVTGVMLALVVLVGSPLPAWLFRGFYAESIASVLLGLAMMTWLITEDDRRVSRFAWLAVGLAVSFHPVMLVVALPLLILLAASSAERPIDVVVGLAMFAAGTGVLVVMTLFGCSPYGTLSFSSIWFGFMASASHRITLACGAAFLVLLAIAVMVKARLISFYDRLTIVGRHFVSMLPVIGGILVVVGIAYFWSQKDFVVRGLIEAYGGIRLPLGILLACCALIVLAKKEGLRARLALGVVLFALPAFAYLKGAEQMGLWSQRRLLPVYVITTVSFLAAVAGWLQSVVSCLPKPSRAIISVLFCLFLAVAGGSNLCRWPAPYTARCDQGAGSWIRNVERKIGSRMVFFDYYPYSVPFAVTANTKALGLCERAGDITGVIKWLGAKAKHEDVLFASAFNNPGIEDNLVLDVLFCESIKLDRVVSKGALPAEKRVHTVTLNFLQVFPVSGSGNIPVLNKILDDGPLALRGPWGKGRPIKVDGQMLPARWSREGSGIIGPVPLPGQAVKISLEGAADRDDGIDGQVLRIQPPWAGVQLDLPISNDFTKVSSVLRRPTDQADDGARTGIYRIYSSKPYDPGRAGIKGYENDLGARIHKIRIEVIKADVLGVSSDK